MDCIRRGEDNVFMDVSYPHEGIRCGVGVSQAQAPVWEFGCENAIFFFEIRDDMLLMPVDPAGNHSDEDVENHEGSSGWWRRWRLLQHTTSLRKINSIESAASFNLTVLQRSRYFFLSLTSRLR